MQMASVSGLVPTSRAMCRYDIELMHNASDNTAADLERLVGNKTPAEAGAMLAEPDVAVTNQKDKDQQLGVLGEVNEMVKVAWRQMLTHQSSGVFTELINDLLPEEWSSDSRYVKGSSKGSTPRRKSPHRSRATPKVGVAFE